MNSQALTRSLFLAAMALASPAFAGNDINKCIASDGHVTLTDEVCPTGSETVKVINGTSEPVSGSEHYTVARMPARNAPPMRSTPPARGLALDVATLKAARANMQLFDHASQALRAQRIAALQ